MVSEPSYNQPKFSSCATWNPNAITFADNSVVGQQPVGIFININNTIYVTATNLNLVVEWIGGNTNPIRNISNNLINPAGVFATINDDIYVDNGNDSYRVDKWSSNGTHAMVVMNVTSRCFSLFIDINNTLYCSIDKEHKVIKKSLNDDSDIISICAGNGVLGSGSYSLFYPDGIFVDMKFNLYVADFGNNRIQLFQPDQLSGITVASNTTSPSIALSYPTAVILDADGNLYIADLGNHRIVRSGPFGFQCLFGCTGTSGLASNQFNHPYTLSFDSYGNIFVVDSGNSRIQKFLLTSNSCGKFYR